jgi:hypothetical protein
LRVSAFDKDGRFVEMWPYPSRGGIAVASARRITDDGHEDHEGTLAS